MVAAIHHLTSHGIVHRDIKLDNLLVRSEPGDADRIELVLTDFGKFGFLVCLNVSGILFY